MDWDSSMLSLCRWMDARRRHRRSLVAIQQNPYPIGHCWRFKANSESIPAVTARGAPIEIWNQVVFAVPLSENSPCPAVDIQQKRESLVTCLREVDGPSLCVSLTPPTQPLPWSLPTANEP